MNGSILSKDWEVELLGHICKLLSEIAVLIYTPLRNCLFSIPPLVDTIKIIDFYQADISRKWYIGAFFFLSNRYFLYYYLGWMLFHTFITKWVFMSFAYISTGFFVFFFWFVEANIFQVIFLSYICFKYFLLCFVV